MEGRGPKEGREDEADWFIEPSAAGDEIDKAIRNGVVSQISNRERLTADLNIIRQQSNASCSTAMGFLCRIWETATQVGWVDWMDGWSFPPLPDFHSLFHSAAVVERMSERK